MPNLSFLVPGFSKCGTTTFCSFLDQHPDIFIPEEKEPNLFNKPNYLDYWPWYKAMFDAAGPARTLGEGSTFYTTVEFEVMVRERVKKHYPNIKLIFIARDPFNRIESSLREYHHSGPRFGLDTPFDTEQALREIPGIIQDTLYWSRFNNYRDHFPEENIHVLFLEDLNSEPQRELEKCFRFLGVDAGFRIENQDRRLNTASSKLHDTKLLRKLRNTALTGIPLSKISIDTQDRILRRIGLRRKFSKPIDWKPETIRWLLDQIQEDMSAFLAYASKPPDFWPRYSRLLRQAADH